MENLEREIAAIKRSVSADPRQRESLEFSLGEVNEEDLPQTKDVDDGVRHRDPQQARQRHLPDRSKFAANNQ